MNLANHPVRKKKSKIAFDQVLFVVLNETNYNEYHISNEFKNSPWKNWSVLYKKESSSELFAFGREALLSKSYSFKGPVQSLP